MHTTEIVAADADTYLMSGTIWNLLHMDKNFCPSFDNNVIWCDFM